MVIKPKDETIVEHVSDCEVRPGSFWERLQDESDFPLIAMLCVTERCPMKCAHCYQTERTGREELDLGGIEDLLDQLAALGVFRFSITGGEPALRDDLHQIVEAAWKRKFLVSLKTTAALLNKQDIERLRENGLSSLAASLYHIEPSEHDEFVGREGAWRHAMSALETFSDLGGISTVSTVIMDWNTGAIAPLIDMCEPRGWDLVADAKVLRADDGSDAAAGLRASGDTQLEAMKNLPNARQRRPVKEPGDQLCLAGITSVYIKPNGDVWLCPAMPVSLGNIRDRSFREIWTESEFRKQVMGLKWGDSDTCMACEENRFCQRCPGEAFKEHGSFTAPATVDCEVARAHARIWRENGGDDD